MNSTVPIIVAVLVMTISVVSGLQCYSCEGRDNEMCGREPTRANRITCATNEMCNVLRTERSDFSGRTVTYSRGCRQSAFAGAVGGNGVGVSTSSQSCSTDLCNTGDGLGPSINFPGFNNGFGFNTNNNNNDGFGGFAGAGFNGGFQNDFNRQPGNGAPAGTKTNYNPLMLPFLGLVSSILGNNV
ncbi:Uncharacterized protein APZ42_032296 [Daphnia magna]|uniref:Uncharacterized protein n=2 Tax=Daphnia magna TaxID=35525 RepID=A0A164M3L1_9CRUS|nr:hypothetical protein OUZ56_030147 [Daphnia magna]KZS04694.1 Uncharacterized protein APZ42_032296 [Daphnia magna]